MSHRLSVLLMTAILGSALIPGRVAAQTDNSSQAVAQLDKRLEELRAEMNKIEAELNELKAAKGAPPSTAAGASTAAASSGRHEGLAPARRHRPLGRRCGSNDGPERVRG